MDMSYFKDNIAPKLSDYKLTYSSYPEGDFGSLERVVIEGDSKVSGIDIWSKGWLDIDIYDLKLDKQVMTILLEPVETEKKKNSINLFLDIMLNE
ncbi:hypothetical protein L2C91_00945 [Rosenbergiella epipactidis]|uniref:hypothetical protein n=1 Tax=Rosenbergiella TaxID=1356488 RepID=UPI001F500CDA|nr:MULTISPECIES: hypothetical protein [Rosenbergiella]MCL9666965.1 hypothetical protein [Rosenbergiella epipactidis]